MTTITSKPHLEAYDPVALQILSDHTWEVGSTPSSHYMTVEQLTDYMDKLSEGASGLGRYLRANSQQTADKYNVQDSILNTAEIANVQQRIVNLAKSYINTIRNALDFLFDDNLDWLANVSGEGRVAAIIAAVNEGVARAKSGLECLQTFATAHLGLQGQLTTQDGNGNYRLGAFVLTSSGADHTIRTGSDGVMQIVYKNR